MAGGCLPGLPGLPRDELWATISPPTSSDGLRADSGSCQPNPPPRRLPACRAATRRRALRAGVRTRRSALCLPSRSWDPSACLPSSPWCCSPPATPRARPEPLAHLDRPAAAPPPRFPAERWALKQLLHPQRSFRQPCRPPTKSTARPSRVCPRLSPQGARNAYRSNTPDPSTPVWRCCWLSCLRHRPPRPADLRAAPAPATHAARPDVVDRRVPPARLRRARPYAITAGPDGALWFTEESASRIGRITLSGGTSPSFPCRDQR